MLVPDRANARWSLDFVSDALADGRRFRYHGGATGDPFLCANPQEPSSVG